MTEAPHLPILWHVWLAQWPVLTSYHNHERPGHSVIITSQMSSDWFWQFICALWSGWGCKLICLGERRIKGKWREEATPKAKQRMSITGIWHTQKTETDTHIRTHQLHNPCQGFRLIASSEAGRCRSFSTIHLGIVLKRTGIFGLREGLSIHTFTAHFES